MTEFAFLDADFAAAVRPRRQVNVFELAGFPRRETVASNVLAYFLDPGERHGMTTVFVDSVLTLVDGSPLLGSDGFVEGRTLSGDDELGSESWIVTTEHSTREGARIDILLVNVDLDLAIVIENKVDAAVYNPFESYVAEALRHASRVLCVVLAPTLRATEELSAGWVSKAITYDDLFDRAAMGLVPIRSEADPRSIEILEHFIENFSERVEKMEHEVSAAVLDRYFEAVGPHDQGILDFLGAILEVNAVLEERGKVLSPQIVAALESRDLLAEHWMTMSFKHRWGMNDRILTVAYLTFVLKDTNVIELMLGHHPREGWRGFAVKAYPNRSRTETLYPDFNHTPLDLAWTAPDDEVVGAFVERVDALLEAHPKG